MAAELTSGVSVDEVLQNAPKWLPKVDRQLISAGAASGRLADIFQQLAFRHEIKSKMATKAVGASVYPLLVLHFAIIALPAEKIFSEDFSAYFSSVVSVLIPFWIFLAALVFAVMKKIRGVIRLIMMLPLLKSYRENQALADLCFTLNAFLTAGCRIDVAWFGASEATGVKRYAKIGLEMVQVVSSGQSPGDYLKQTTAFSTDFVQLYCNGEKTGQLEKNLEFLNRQYQTAAENRMSAASFWYPKLLFAGVAFYIAFKVLSFYIGYFRQIGEMLEM
jgi:type II secretory pathway component PulF